MKRKDMNFMQVLLYTLLECAIVMVVIVGFVELMKLIK